MADRLRRSKDVLKKKISNYLQTTTSGAYLKYFEGSPTYITYYQLDSTASLQDIGLENVNSLVGANTPSKYKKILSVPVWGVDALDVSNEINERGLQASVNGELLFLPNSVRPYAADFFVFEYTGLETHLFRINDVQYDKLTPEKFFRTQYSLYQANASEIFDNVSDVYECQYDDSNGTVKIVKQEDAVASEESKNLVDALIDKFATMFYDEETDSFICHDRKFDDSEFSYWSPYLQHFLHETKALDKYNPEILTEFYINDINEVDNWEIYNEQAYRSSIFRSVQIQDNDVNFDMNFLCVPEYDLKCTRNLPFFMSTLKFKLVTPIINGKEDPTAYLKSFPVLFADSTPLFEDVDHYHKVHKMDEVHLSRLEPYLKSGDIIYECYRHELEPTKMCLALEKKDESGNTYLEIEDVSIERLMKESIDTTEIDSLELFNIIKDYLNGSFKITDTVVNTLNSRYYRPSIQNYVLLPLIIFILKQSIQE